MMKQVVILFVALIMMVKPLWPVVEYVMNYDYIVNVLCENKDKPQLNCDGKCYLAKQLEKAAKHDGQNPFEQPNTNHDLLELLFLQPSYILKFDSFFRSKTNRISTISETLVSSLYVWDVIQPPELI